MQVQIETVRETLSSEEVLTLKYFCKIIHLDSMLVQERMKLGYKCILVTARILIKYFQYLVSIENTNKYFFKTKNTKISIFLKLI